jgi:UDPglucose 6-dehydrogenase
VIVGTEADCSPSRLADLFAPFSRNVIWMSLESAEMTKHALNSFLATSVTFINEVARLCEVVGADAKEVERGLKSDARIGGRAYLAPGAAFAGGTLARDLRFLAMRSRANRVQTPLIDGVLTSNQVHQDWLRDRALDLLFGLTQPVVAILGLTYKAGTSTLRRSSAVELCRWLQSHGVEVRGHDPSLRALPPELVPVLRLADEPLEALDGADLAVLTTAWPQYRKLSPADLHARMRRATVLDPARFLDDVLGTDPRVHYVATGTPRIARV